MSAIDNLPSGLDVRKGIVNLFNSKEYQELKNYYNRRSFFDVLGIMRNENIHSNFLAWLLDSRHNNGLNDYPIKKFLEMLIIMLNECNYVRDGQVLFPDYLIDHVIAGNYHVQSVKVEREKHIRGNKRIDIFIDSELRIEDSNESILNLKILLENKVHSKEHDDQTNQYFKWAKSEFGKEQVLLFVFLTPIPTTDLLSLTEQACNCKQYIQINYQYIVNYLLEPCSNQDLPSESKYMIDNYLRCLSFPSLDNEEFGDGGLTMAVSERERGLLLDFWEKNKPLLLAMLNVLKDDENIDEDERKNMQNMIGVMLTKSARDYSQYNFHGSRYGKNRLVHAVIKEYLKNYNCSYKELRSVFKDEIQGSRSVLKPISDIKEKEQVRYFTKPDEILVTKDNIQIAVCNQWGIGNIVRFIDVAKDLGFAIERVENT